MLTDNPVILLSVALPYICCFQVFKLQLARVDLHTKSS